MSAVCVLGHSSAVRPQRPCRPLPRPRRRCPRSRPPPERCRPREQRNHDQPRQLNIRSCPASQLHRRPVRFPPLRGRRRRRRGLLALLSPPVLGELRALQGHASRHLKRHRTTQRAVVLAWLERSRHGSPRRRTLTTNWLCRGPERIWCASEPGGGRRVKMIVLRASAAHCTKRSSAAPVHRALVATERRAISGHPLHTFQ